MAVKSAAKRVALETLGWIMVIGGIAAIPLPGPGLLILFGGLALLSQQYEWAEKRVDPVKNKALHAAATGVETNTRIVISLLGIAALVACGVLWIVQPPAPSWWPVDEYWWLWGGWGTGSTQIASAVVGLALLIYSIHRFRVRGEEPPGD